MARFELRVSVSTLEVTKVNWQRKGITKGAYCALLIPARPYSFYLGAGYVTDASFLYASAAGEALRSILDEGEIDLEDEAFELEIAGNCGGVDAKLASSVRQWVKAEGRGADGRSIQNFETWRKLDELSGLGKVRFRKADEAQQKTIRLLLESKPYARELPAIEPDSHLYMKHWQR